MISSAPPAALAVLALAGAAASAAPPAAPAPRALVDVFVAGESGVTLTGLRAADFEVREDGVEVPAVACVAPVRAAAQQLTVVLVVDELAVPPERRAALAAAERAVRDILAGGGSRVMLVAWGAAAAIAQPFTADAALLARALAAPVRSDGAGSVALETIVAALGPLPGRKAIVVLGGPASAASGRAEAFRSLADAANVAGATVYWVDASGGRAPEAEPAAAPGAAAAARTAVELTGGLDATGQGDLAEALFQITRDLRGAWSVAFTPASRPDGAPHRLAVRVRREGVAARARASFANVDEDRRTSERSASALLLGYEDNPLGIQVSLAIGPKAADGTQVVTVQVAVPLSGLEFEPTAVSHDCDLTLWLAARDGDGKVIRAPRAKFPVSVPNDRLLTALAQSAAYEFRVPMKAGPAAVAVTVRDEIGATTATALASAAPAPEPTPGATP